MRRKMTNCARVTILILALTATTAGQAQANGDFTVVRAEVDFGKKSQAWDDLAVNHVEAPQILD